MSKTSLEKRLRVIEGQLEEVRRRLAGIEQPWWEKIWGRCAGDPSFHRAADLGRRYRKSTGRPNRRRSSR